METENNYAGFVSAPNAIRGQTKGMVYVPNQNHICDISWDGNTIKWWSDYGAQLNNKNITYFYIAIG